MALVRILVDGYSLLHNWAELAPGRPRHSATAREALIHKLMLYHDATSTPITIFFDGASATPNKPEMRSTPALEILYSRAGQTADQMIERAAHRLREFGDVLAVTDDYAERDTVTAMGGMVSSCWNFIQTVESALTDMKREIKNHNLGERDKFSRRQTK